MAIELDRRSVVLGLGATAAAAGAARATPMPDMTYKSAGEQIAALARREVSAVELLDAAIARVEALDARLNAVVVRDFARAREAASAADAALARGERRPLLGLPMTVKEQYNVAGLPTTWGDPKHKGWIPEGDALAVARLKAAGAVIFGKTNVPIHLSDWQSYNDIYGTTNNPWDATRTPGGSSGGAAVALAAGFTALELGSDIGGSLRAPAHYCGVCAHKPSLDLVPLRGGGPPKTPAIPVRGDLAVAGPMARHAADLGLGLDVLAGPDEWWDGIAYKLDLPPARHTALKDFRVLLIETHPLVPTAQSIRGALDRLGAVLEKAGCTVSRSSPAMPNLAFTTRVYVELLSAFFAADMGPERRQRDEAIAKTLRPDDDSLGALWVRGAVMDHAAWIKTGWVRNGLRMRWQALFKQFDVLLCPVMPSPAFPHDHAPRAERMFEVDGRKIRYSDQVAWIAAPTLTGLPATAAPIGRSENGLPIGVQIIGPYLGDRTTIAFAAALEREIGGFVPPPL